MTYTISGTTQVGTALTAVAGSGLFGNPPAYAIQATDTVTYAAGTGAGKIDRIYSYAGTISSATVIDLTNFTDWLGNTGQSMARVRFIGVRLTSTTDGQDLKFGYATTTANAWTGLISNPGQLIIKPAYAPTTGPAGVGTFQMDAPNTTGWPVSSTSKLVQFDPGSNTLAVKILILGCSA